jgi:PHD/YefM family antitoxin component YafN of YafNO toxin-antitoxin module
VLVSKEEFDNMVENLYVMSNPKWVKSIKKGISELDKGKGKKLTLEQVLRIKK